MVDITSLTEIIVSYVAIYFILTVALNIKAGLTGIPDFGHAMFFAIGGIVVANLAARIAAAFVASQIGVSPGEAAHLVIADNTATMVKVNAALATRPILDVMLIIFSLVAALILGGLLGWLASYPALRLRGDYLAIMLLTASEGLRILLMYTKPVMGATPTVGLTTPQLFKFTDDPGLWSTVFVALLAVIVFIYAERFHNSPSGRLFRAVRDDEESAEAVGKDIAKVRRDSMIIGSALAAVAGVAYSFSPWIAGSSIAAQSIFDRVQWTFFPWALMILGGMGSNKGISIATIIVGASIIGPINIYKNDIAEALHVTRFGFDTGSFANALQLILIALLILLVLFFRPKGIIPEPPSYTLKPRELREMVKEVVERRPTEEAAGGSS